MFENKWWKLQLFAEGAPAADGGAAGGDGAAETGVTAPAAGEQELLKLGVPKNRITNRASAAVGKMAQDGTRAGKPAQQAAAVAGTEEGTKDDAAAKGGFRLPQGTTVEEVIANPEVNKYIQGIISKRVNDSKADADALAALRPALEVLARAHKLDPANLDYAALSKAVESDDRYYEDMALANGVDVDTARQMDKENRENERQQEQLRQDRMRQQVAAWRQEEQQLKASMPGFDLNKEAENPTFMNLLRAGFGVKNAYEAVHHAEIVAAERQAAFTQAQQQTVAQIRAGNSRPAELGSTQTPAAAPNPQMTPQVRERIRADLSRGIKVDPRKYGII